VAGVESDALHEGWAVPSVHALPRAVWFSVRGQKWRPDAEGVPGIWPLKWTFPRNRRQHLLLHPSPKPGGSASGSRMLASTARAGKP